MIFSVKYSDAQVCDRVQTDAGMIVKSSVVGKCVECKRHTAWCHGESFKRVCCLRCLEKYNDRIRVRDTN